MELSAMSPASQELAERARPFASLILRRLADVGQVRLAEAIGVSEATISRWKDSDVQRTAEMLLALGLRVWPEDAIILERPDYIALLQMADRGLQAMRDPR